MDNLLDAEHLQQCHRLTSLIKSFDTDMKKKAPVFDMDDLTRFLSKEMTTPYWLVRKLVIIFAHFGGLRLTEVMDLKVMFLIFVSS